MICEPKVYRAIFRNRIPKKILCRLDLRTIRLTKTHFVDQRLRHLYSDCLFSVRQRDGSQARIYVLVEHQSSSDYWMSFRIWQYVFEAWADIKRQAENKQVKLPLIIPLVIYNGAKPYKHSLDLRDLIDSTPEMIDQILFQPIDLIELNAIEDKALADDLYLGTMFLSLKHAFDEAMPYDKIIVHLAKIKDKKLRLRFLLAVLRYIFSVRSDVDEQKLNHIIGKRFTEAEGAEAMTFAEKLRMEGEERGEKNGILKVAINFLKSGFDESVVSENTGLPINEIRQLKLDHGSS